MPLNGRTLEAQTVEGLEQLRLLLVRETWPSVRDLDTDAVAAPGRAQDDQPARGAVFDGVVGQIADHLRQTLGIGPRHQVIAGGHDVDLHRRRFRIQQQAAADVLQHAGDIGRANIHLDRARLGPRHIEQVVGQGLDLAGRLDQHLRHLDLVGRGGAQVPSGPQFADADDAADRALDLMGHIGQQPRFGRRGALGPQPSFPGALHQPVTLFQQGGDHQDRHIAQQDQQLRQQGAILGIELMIGTVPGHGAADGHHRHHQQGPGRADHAKAHRREHDQRQQQKAVRQAHMRKDGVAGAGEQHAQPDGLGQARGLLQHPEMRLAQAQSEHADHGEAQGMAAPPDTQGVQKVLVRHIEQGHGGDQGRRQGRDRAYGQETRQALHAVDMQPRDHTTRQHDRQNDLQQIGQGEEDRQRRTVARQDLAGKDARQQQDAETEVVLQAAAAAQPYSHSQAAGAPQGGDQTVGASEADRENHQHGHAQRGQHRSERSAEEVGVRRRQGFNRSGPLARRVQCDFSSLERAAHAHQSGLELES
ncbi:hypothetical protein BDIM_20500 [Brevundimonas diminuta ATCC 11568]|nr:hypothetical protein BDIM_20500 [Brevundimonas diminuta ATCC 11568]